MSTPGKGEGQGEEGGGGGGGGDEEWEQVGPKNKSTITRQVRGCGRAVRKEWWAGMWGWAVRVCT